MTTADDAVPCFFCRFNFGFTISTLEPGVVGFIILLSTITCLITCTGLCICCYCTSRTAAHEYVQVGAMMESQHSAKSKEPSASN